MNITTEQLLNTTHAHSELDRLERQLVTLVRECPENNPGRAYWLRESLRNLRTARTFLMRSASANNASVYHEGEVR